MPEPQPVPEPQPEPTPEPQPEPTPQVHAHAPSPRPIRLTWRRCVCVFILPLACAAAWRLRHVRAPSLRLLREAIGLVHQRPRRAAAAAAPRAAPPVARPARLGRLALRGRRGGAARSRTVAAAARRAASRGARSARLRLGRRDRGLSRRDCSGRRVVVRTASPARPLARSRRARDGATAAARRGARRGVAERGAPQLRARDLVASRLHTTPRPGVRRGRYWGGRRRRRRRRRWWWK